MRFLVLESKLPFLPTDKFPRAWLVSRDFSLDDAPMRSSDDRILARVVQHGRARFTDRTEIDAIGLTDESTLLLLLVLS